MNPLQFLLNSLLSSPRVVNNPMAKNVLDMAKNGNISGIEQFGRNIARERGVDFDQAFMEFKQKIQNGNCNT